MNENDYIPLDQCVEGHLYRIESRNLVLGVFDGKTGFIGIRVKFGCTHLFTEYHWDQGPPYGTVQPQKDLGPIPDDIEIYEYRKETIDRKNSVVQNDKMFEYLAQKKVDDSII
ncbi:MAG: hypothetical protein P8Y80_04650 [Acidobacteriota bacterium]|jgi:hypothetical protein